jgi:hypothetical protein
VARLGLVLLPILVLVGCSRAPSYTQNESVEGTVTLDGQPVANVVVQFVPNIDPEVQAPMSSGSTDEKGHFRLTCDNKRPGAVVGKHNVVVLAGRAGAADEDEAKGGQRGKGIPAVYGVAAKTPLKIEVTADRHTYDLPLTRTGR